MSASLAKSVEVSSHFISRIKSGARRPSPQLALKISRATGGLVSVEELLFPDRDEDPNELATFSRSEATKRREGNQDSAILLPTTCDFDDFDDRYSDAEIAEDQIFFNGLKRLG